MIVRSGITGFFVHRDIPEFGFAEFKSIVTTSTNPMGFRVLEFVERGVTPNFHIAKVARQRDELWILGHGNFPIIAFAEPFSPMPMQIPFRDAGSLATRILGLFPHLTIATEHDLSQCIQEADLEKLNRIERDQVKYWQPTNIGQLAFNYWD